MRIRASSVGCGGISSDSKGRAHRDPIKERKQLLGFYQRKGLELCPNCEGGIKKNIYLKHILKKCTCIKPKKPTNRCETLKKVYEVDPPSGYFRQGCIKILRSKEVFKMAVKALKENGVGQKTISKFQGIFETKGLSSHYLNEVLKIKVGDKKIEFDWKITQGEPIQMAIIITSENRDDSPKSLYIRVPVGLQIRFPQEFALEIKKPVLAAQKTTQIHSKGVLIPDNQKKSTEESQSDKFPRKKVREQISDKFLEKKVISFKKPIMLSEVSKEMRMKPHELIQLFKTLGYKASMAHEIPEEKLIRLFSKIGIRSSKIEISS
jgi:hypothetical protein